MHIVVLDGFTLNPGDLSWDALQKLGQVTIYERTPAELIVERAAEAEMVLTNKTPLRADTLANLPKLKYIGVLATGYDVVDTKAAAEKGITVTNVPEYSTDSVAQLVFALLLELCHHAALHSQSVKAGDWAKSADFCYWKTPLIELAGKTMGIIGLGRIGSRVAELAQAFGMKVVAAGRPGSSAGKQGDIVRLPLEEVLRQSDVISLHCPLTPDTEKLINADTLGLMKPSAFLINTSRGKLIDEAALAAALNEGRLAAAAVDVLSEEPPQPDHPLIQSERCLITPHIAWATQQARARLMSTAVANIQAYLDGKPVNRVG